MDPVGHGRGAGRPARQAFLGFSDDIVIIVASALPVGGAVARSDVMSACFAATARISGVPTHRWFPLSRGQRLAKEAPTSLSKTRFSVRCRRRSRRIGRTADEQGCSENDHVCPLFGVASATLATWNNSRPRLPI
jgi:hypothetical protein